MVSANEIKDWKILDQSRECRSEERMEEIEDEENDRGNIGMIEFDFGVAGPEILGNGFAKIAIIM